MGNIVGSAMEENLNKQQEFMAKTQELTLNRQLAMQNAMIERQMAMQVSRARELLNWTGSFAAILALGLSAGAIKNKKPAMLGPLLPIGYVVGYQWDMAYNDKMERIRKMAEEMMANEGHLLLLPNDMPRFQEIEMRRLRASKD